jgi:predicted Zn-dependent protease
MKRRLMVFLFPVLLVLGCATSTEEGEVGIRRKQFFAVSSEEVNQISTQQYSQLKAEAQKKGVLDKDPKQVSRVQAIAKRIVPVTDAFRDDAPKWPWEVHVIDSPELNAFCLPGGKMMFFSGVIQKLQLTDNEIAAIMGHEMAHALREHGRERASKEAVKQGVLQVGVGLGKISNQTAQIANIGATIFLFRYDREQELEADKMGLELMARAGYDPNAAVTLWKKMTSAGGGKGPEWMSTHPSDDRRMSTLRSLLPTVLPLYHNSARLN